MAHQFGGQITRESVPGIDTDPDSDSNTRIATTHTHKSRDDLHSFGYDTPDIPIRPGSYTTLLDATRRGSAESRNRRGHRREGECSLNCRCAHMLWLS